jgi:hypothetical protein
MFCPLVEQLTKTFSLSSSSRRTCPKQIKKKNPKTSQNEKEKQETCNSTTIKSEKRDPAGIAPIPKTGCKIFGPKTSHACNGFMLPQR